MMIDDKIRMSRPATTLSRERAGKKGSTIDLFSYVIL
jgi:hypothetical protein